MTVGEISQEYRFSARICALLVGYLRDSDRGTALHAFLGVKLAHLLIYDTLIARGLDFDAWHRKRYHSLCAERDRALTMLGIDSPPDFVAVGAVH
ncbi:MAG: hypothetical protein WAK04_17195 [Xanthobacteraceae bacterium]